MSTNNNFDNWKEFEQIVAALHRYKEDIGFKVNKNEIIKGREFDVTLHYGDGLYKYLTVIECKNYKNKVPVDVVRAFATKMREVHANKGALFSVKGFQKGAIECAKDHNITLYVLNKDISEIKNVIKRGGFGGIVIYNLKALDQQCNEIPGVTGHANECLLDIITLNNGTKITLGQLIDQHQNEILKLKPTIKPPTKSYTLLAPKGCKIFFRHLNKMVDLSMISFEVLVRESIFEGPPEYNFEVTNALTGEKTVIPHSDLPIGFNTTIEPGKFYKTLDNWKYFCLGVTENSINMFFLEGLSRPISYVFEFDKKYSDKYLQITDENEINRLYTKYKTIIEEQRRKL
jgi:Restriction endonuclease